MADGTTEFAVTDKLATDKVVFKGDLPDLFREGQGVVTEGAFDPNGVFVAREVLAKHDERYMPKEVADALKKNGEWARRRRDRRELFAGVAVIFTVLLFFPAYRSLHHRVYLEFEQSEADARRDGYDCSSFYTASL